MGRMRMLIFVAAAFVPAVASAQQPCTTDARLVVDRLYRQILGRPADSGAASFESQLSRQRVTVRDVIDRIATSDEYAQRFVVEGRSRNMPGSYERAVDTLYRKLMNRAPSGADRARYARIADDEGFGAAVEEILASREYVQRFGDWQVPGANVRYCGDSRSAYNRGDRDFNSDDRFGSNDRSGSNDRFGNGGGVDRTDRGVNGTRGFGNRDTAGTSGRLVVVSGTQQWTDTGIDVRAGDRVQFNASGSVRLSPDANDTASPDGSTINRQAPGAPVHQQTAGALIGRIGNGAPFFVGSQGTVDARANGRLFLAVNDDYFNDNSGEFRVDVQFR